MSDPDDGGRPTSELLAACAGIAVLHTVRADGPLGGGDLPGVSERRLSFARRLGATERDGRPCLASVHQVHGSRVVVVEAEDVGRTGPLGRADGLLTRESGVALLVQGADCPLVALHDPTTGLVGAVHSGWRGTVAGVVPRALELAIALGSRVDDLSVVVFPGIGPERFEVGPEVVEQFRERFGDVVGSWTRPSARAHEGRVLLDLQAAIAHSARTVGVPATQVELVAGCTVEDARLHSHRGSGGAPERHALLVLRTTG